MLCEGHFRDYVNERASGGEGFAEAVYAIPDALAMAVHLTDYLSAVNPINRECKAIYGEKFNSTFFRDYGIWRFYVGVNWMPDEKLCEKPEKREIPILGELENHFPKPALASSTPVV